MLVRSPSCVGEIRLNTDIRRCSEFADTPLALLVLDWRLAGSVCGTFRFGLYVVMMVDERCNPVLLFDVGEAVRYCGTENCIEGSVIVPSFPPRELRDGRMFC